LVGWVVIILCYFLTWNLKKYRRLLLQQKGVGKSTYFIMNCNNSFIFNFSFYFFTRRFFSYLCFFFLFSLLTTKMHNYSLSMKRYFTMNCNISFTFNFSSYLCTRRFFSYLCFFFLFSLLDLSNMPNPSLLGLDIMLDLRFLSLATISSSRL
jgi:hypothetical protein